jgi:hypothetical protein
VFALKRSVKTHEYLALLYKLENLISKSEAARVLLALGMKSLRRRLQPLRRKGQLLAL